MAEKKSTKPKTDLPALADECTQEIEARVKKLQASKELDLPPDYSVANALKSAYLILQETVNREKKPVLEVCTRNSIANSLFDMIVQGLNPGKEQCYFIAYGNRLTCNRSYFGDETLVKRIDPNIADVIAEPIYEGDTVSYSIVNGKKIIKEHLQTLDSVSSARIKGGYASIINKAGEIQKTEIMTIDEIKQSWKQSRMSPVTNTGEIKEGTTHKKFTAEMVRRTLIRKICKPIINSSNDAYLRRSVTQTDIQATEGIVSNEIAENANKTPIDVNSETGEVVDAEIVETPQAPPEEPKTEKNTKPPVESEEATEEQEDPEFEPGEDPISVDLKTGKQEKEEKTKKGLKSDPKYVAELNKWLDDVPPKMRYACMEEIKKKRFPNMTVEDQDKVLQHYDELIGAAEQTAEPEF